MSKVVQDTKDFVGRVFAQDLAFLFLCAYITFSYLRPHVIYPALNVLPWTQISILGGLLLLAAKKEIHLGRPVFLLLLYMAVILISASGSLYPETSWARLDSAYIWIIEVLFFVSCVRSVEQYKLILILFLIYMFKMSLFGARTWISRGFGFEGWGIAGPAGFFANSGEFSLLMALTAVLSICVLVGFGKLKSWYVLLPITAVMTVLGASSRGSQLALLVGVVFLVLAYKKINLKYLLFFALLGWGVYSIIPDEQRERLHAMGTDDTSLSRLAYWEAGIDMAKNNPLFGIGFYGFPEHFDNFYKTESMIGSEYLANRREVAHNSYIEVASGLGFVGLAVYLALILHVFSNSMKAIKLSKDLPGDNKFVKHMGIGIIGALVVYCVGSLFMSVAFYPYIYLLIMFSYTLMRNAKGTVKSSKARTGRTRKVGFKSLNGNQFGR